MSSAVFYTVGRVLILTPFRFNIFYYKMYYYICDNKGDTNHTRHLGRTKKGQTKIVVPYRIFLKPISFFVIGTTV